MTYAMFFSSHRLLVVLERMAALAFLLALYKPKLATRFFNSVEASFHSLAKQPWRPIFAAVLFPMLVRLVMLPWYPPPNPQVHDEFSYLLQGDTFAHGRLANPVPPYWEHFETEYVLFNPTYASQYQPGQGLVLAAGQLLFFNPWWGVWLSVGIMCGSIFWALRFVIPPAWALFGSFMAAMQFGIFGIWMNSYFGGAVAATAGALVLGSVMRMREPGKARSSAALCGLGIILLFATRPLEAILWSGVAVVFMVAAVRRTRRAATPVNYSQLCIPFAVVIVVGVGALAYYNWRVTGSPANPPYLQYRQVYGTPQPYWWQPPVIVNNFNYPEIRDNYLNQLRLYEARYSPTAILLAEGERLRNFWRFFIGPFLTPALLFLAWIFRDRRIRPWLFASVPFVLDKATYHAWFPSQNAPATVLIVLVVVQCWRHLRVWQRRRQWGVAVTRLTMASFAIAIFLGGLGRAVEPLLPDQLRHLPPIWESLYPIRRLRDDVTEILTRVPGKHLVFVKYAPGHCFCEEWVFNSADIASQRIIYARPYSPSSDAALIETFKDHDAWVVEPDERPYRLSRLNDSEQVARLSRPADDSYSSR
jgi:hypothetical protein